tara:strand:- start:739 stop:891 length:153 start_codon:yes stop_codon:yes gene_type:complete
LLLEKIYQQTYLFPEADAFLGFALNLQSELRRGGEFNFHIAFRRICYEYL